MKHIIIIGNGIAGVTAARHIRKLSRDKITIISEESSYFFSRTALMYVYMGHMKFEHTQPYESHFWTENKIDLLQDRVEQIETKKQVLHLKSGNEVPYDQLIIATGSKPNKFGWPGQDAHGVSGLYHKQDLERIEKLAPNNKACKRAVIIGGGLIGIELAEMLRARNIPVTFLVREKSFWRSVLPEQESQLITRHIFEHHIDLKLGVNLQEIKTNEQGKVQSIIIKETGEEIPCDFVGLTAGVSPNISFLENSGIETNRGVLVNRKLETNVENIFAIGDCAEQRVPIENRRPIEAVWYTGKMMGETVAQTICGNPKEYQPSHWFNSAKFLDIEYQTYGWVWANPKENEARFYWEDQTGKKAMHFSFDKNTREFIGLNTFGIRLRHNVCHSWLEQKSSIEEVLSELKDANFDPELYKTYEEEILKKFNQEFKSTIKAKKRNWNRILHHIWS
ncbi:MAG: NAD(P)/FAD-dependent oxidoreductase [Flavobacteriales bacterium]|jgi:NADPH-dependent 2,4-dienoyl-CoA reductase/sulfur reductase-like enzyme|nr:NAD(P)/FAD-dependent oxidoreductase [Flavobacteriales bacterium]